MDATVSPRKKSSDTRRPEAVGGGVFWGILIKRIKFNQLPVMSSKIDWSVALRPLLKKYKDKTHPLEYHSTYQLVVMVVLSAQSTDNFINKIAPGFFAVYPDMHSLAKARPEDLWPY